MTFSVTNLNVAASLGQPFQISLKIVDENGVGTPNCQVIAVPVYFLTSTNEQLFTGITDAEGNFSSNSFIIPSDAPTGDYDIMIEFFVSGEHMPGITTKKINIPAPPVKDPEIVQDVGKILFSPSDDSRDVKKLFFKKGEYGTKLLFTLCKPDGNPFTDLSMATAINLSISCDLSVQTETLTIADEPKGVVSYILKDGDLLRNK